VPAIDALLVTVPKSRDMTTPLGAGRAHDQLEAADVAASMVGVREVAYAAARWRVTGDELGLPLLQRALGRVLDRLERGRRPVVLDNEEREVVIGLVLVLQRRPVAEEVMQATFACESELRWRRILRPAVAELERTVEGWVRQASFAMHQLLDGDAA
jgi:hypothetical protein